MVTITVVAQPAKYVAIAGNLLFRCLSIFNSPERSRKIPRPRGYSQHQWSGFVQGELRNVLWVNSGCSLQYRRLCNVKSTKCQTWIRRWQFGVRVTLIFSSTTSQRKINILSTSKQRQMPAGQYRESQRYTDMLCPWHALSKMSACLSVNVNAIISKKKRQKSSK